jgi:oligopeptide/dipeptide ABC transporter ATP-binding protein
MAEFLLGPQSRTIGDLRLSGEGSVAEDLLDVRNLQTHFFTHDGIVKAVDDVTFSIRRGEVLGIVGESGCGKSVTALSIMRLITSPPGRITGGKITFEGQELLHLSDREIREIRGNRIAMIFQEPMTSLNPVFTVGFQIAEALTLHRNFTRNQAWDTAAEMLSLVGIASPKLRIKEFPHQLSGGMRQRVMIAMALSCRPSLLIADEPTTALDVTIQAQILDLIAGLRGQYGMAVMFITHDLGVIAENADQVIVMYAGKIVEEANVYRIFENPAHPYTRGLLNSIPTVDEQSRSRTLLKAIPGIVPNLLALPAGCHFQDRCAHASERCSKEEPALFEVEEAHYTACFLYDR